MRSRGTSRLGLTVTLGRVPAGRQPVRLRELKPGPGAHPEVPSQEHPAGLASQLLRLLKPTTQERQAMAAGPRAREPGGWKLGECTEGGGQLALATGKAGRGLGSKHLLDSAH